jgi:fumarylacetoacetase
VRLPDGETRSFLEDGDEITLRAWCESGGAVRIGFGECVGRVVAAA